MTLLDTLRGFAVVIMIIFHIEYDLVFMFGASWLASSFYWQSNYSWMATSLFVLLAGVTVRFSREPAKHGAKILVIAAGFTLVTAFIFPGSAIYFGVLHLIASGMLVYSLIGTFTDRIPWWVGALLCAVIFALTFNTPNGYFGFGEFSLDVPEMLRKGSFMYPFGFIKGNYRSVDYLPLLPWLFMFLCGTFIGRPVTQNKMPEFFYKDICPPLTWLGRHSLIIYILHQPVVYALLYIIYLFI